MLRCSKTLLIFLFCFAILIPQYSEANEIDSLTTLLSDTHDAVKRISICTLLSEAYLQSDLDKALTYANEALVLSERTGDEEYLLKIYGLLGDIAVVRDSLDVARNYYLTALQMHQSQDNSTEMAGFLTVLGNIAFVHDDLAGALDYYHKGVDYAIENGQDEFLNHLYLNIGSINLRLQNTQAAQDYYTKALERFVRYGDSLNIASAYSNLGSTYIQLKNFSTAEEYFSKALEIYLPLRAYNRIATAYLSMAEIESLKMNYEVENDFLLLALDYSELTDIENRGPRQILLADIYGRLGNNYLRLNDRQKAYEYTLRGYMLGLSNGQIATVSKTAEDLAKIWGSRDRFDSAYYYHKIFKTYADSMANVENVKIMAYQNARFEYEQRLAADKLINEKQKDIQNRNRLIFIFVIVGLIMLLLVLILFLKLGRNKIKRVQLEQNNLKSELELRNKELTTNVLYQVKTNEFILNLSKKLKIALSNILPENRSKVNEVIREIEMDSTKETWKEFEIRFQNVHTGFYKKLSKKYPELTSNELRICAFLKLNMSTKDIAAITFQTTNSITVARWRLRQKFGLDKDANLVSFLSQF